MAIDLLKKIGQSTVTVVIIPNERYSEFIVEIAGEISRAHSATCYVSLNKLYNALVRKLEGNQIDQSKFFFIDGITKSAMPSAPVADNCVYVTSASALTELSLSINQVLSTEQFQCLLFDSLSTLLIYNKSEVVTQFVHDQMSKIMSVNCQAIFTCLEGDTKTDLIKNLGMFVDQVIHLGDEPQQAPPAQAQQPPVQPPQG